MLSDEALYIVRLQNLYQSLDGLVVLVCLCHRNDIGVLGILALPHQVRGGINVGLKRPVYVYEVSVKISGGRDDVCLIHLNDLDGDQIFLDLVYGGVYGCHLRIQFDKAFLFKNLKGSVLIGRIVGNCDYRIFRKLVLGCIFV